MPRAALGQLSLSHLYSCLLSHNLMALAFWLPFYAGAGPGWAGARVAPYANYGNLWQINIFILRFLQFIAVYFALISSRGRKARERKRERVLFVIFIWRGIVDYCPFGSRWGERGSLAMIFRIYLHKCMKNANNATNKQINKQSDNKQAALHWVVSALRVSPSVGNACVMHDGACMEFKIEKQIQSGSAVRRGGQAGRRSQRRSRAHFKD